MRAPVTPGSDTATQFKPGAVRDRRRVFLLLTVLAPLLVICLAEATLRLAGIGMLEPLFIPVAAAPGYLQPNPDAVQRFFPDPRSAPDVSIDTTWFPAQKSDRSLRIFVQGESSAAGFPYGRWASPAALLQQRLQRSYPDRHVEVINTGMAAVTSYVLLDFADEIIAQHPDAVVIYTGHNEYLGIGGVGSSLASAKSPAIARLVASLRHVHLYRALERALVALLPAKQASRRQGGTLLSRIAAERSIPLGSPLYVQGLEQFRGNLERLLARYREAGIPVFIGTLASNERDQPPFASGVDAADSAQALFDQAKALEARGEFQAARTQYLAAKDRDQLRFRAPEAFNDVIRQVAAASDASVVDVQAALAASSPGEIIGADLMLEHVHPNVDGYFKLATAFFGPVVRWAGTPAVVVDDATARREIPTTDVDRLHGEYRVAVLKNDWPFVPERRSSSLPPPANPIEEIAQAWFAGRIGWTDAMAQALARYQQQGNITEAARVAVNLADAVVNAAAAQYEAGKLLVRAKEHDRGQHYLERAIALDGARVEYRLSLAQAQFMRGHAADSIATLEGVLAQQPDDERARYWLGEVRRQAAAPGTPTADVAVRPAPGAPSR